MLDKNSGRFELWVGGAPVCCRRVHDLRLVMQWPTDGDPVYLRKETDEVIIYEWQLGTLAEWLRENLPHLLCEEDFPLPITAESSLDFYKKSGEFDSDDIDEIDVWFTKRQEWYWRHSWYIARAGSYLAEVFFRRVGGRVEIELDNTELYDDITFVSPRGSFFVDESDFDQTVRAFLSDFAQYDEETVYGAILEKGEQAYTHFGKIFSAMGDFHKNYNWLITDCEACPKSHNHMERIHQSESGKYAWISGEELTDILRRDDFQWIWGVLSGFDKDIPKEKVLSYPHPFADCNRGFWQPKLVIQHPLASVEPVAFDSAFTLVLSRDEQTVREFREAFSLSEDLRKSNLKSAAKVKIRQNNNFSKIQ